MKVMPETNFKRIQRERYIVTYSKVEENEVELYRIQDKQY